VRQGFAAYDAGRIDAFELDEIVHHYTQAVGELWRFCAVSDERVAFAVRTLAWWREEGDEPDWLVISALHRQLAYVSQPQARYAAVTKRP